MFYHHLRNELWKLFGKKRTYIGFGAFLVAQNAMLLLFRFTRWHHHMERLLEGNGYLASEFVSALSVAIVMLIPEVLLLMPLYAALVGGDLVAKEAEDGTLRMILTRPISRFGLLFAKWLAGVAFAIVLIIVLGVIAVGFARIWFPWKGLFVWAPEHSIYTLMSANEGFKFYIFSQSLLALNASVVVSLAFMFSCFNMKPAAATILAISLVILSFVIEHIPFFEDYQEWFLTYHFQSWILLFAQPIPWPRIAGALCVLIAVNLTAFMIGTAAFQARDIKS